MPADAKSPIRILLIEDDPGDARLARHALAKAGGGEFEVELAGDLATALRRLASGGIDVILSDLGLPDSEGLSAVKRLQDQASATPILVLTGTFDEARAVEALRKGAQDYLLKDEMTAHSLSRAIRYAIERKRGEEMLAALNRELAEANRQLTASQAELEQRVGARTAELARANQDLETMLFVATHDLKEPLNAIISLARLLADHGAARLDDKGRDLVARLERGAERMRRLLDDLRALTGAQQIELPEERSEAEAAVAGALALLGDAIRERGARIQVGKPLPRWRLERMWATTAIANLVSNALKFTRPGEPPEIEIGAYDGPEGVGVAVRDRGPGVPEELRERIFQLFQRGVGRDVEGTGAGLALVRKIAERHGGHAWVKPRPGGGSEFVITCGVGAAGARPLDLLIVDDDEDFLFLMKDYLADVGSIRGIGVARDGVEALAQLRAAAAGAVPDVILLDINMPRKNGFEVLAELRADPRLRDSPVAMVTSSSRKEDEVKSLAAGASAYVIKPFKLDDLMEVVNRLARDGAAELPA